VWINSLEAIEKAARSGLTASGSRLRLEKQELLVKLGRRELTSMGLDRGERVRRTMTLNRIDDRSQAPQLVARRWGRRSCGRRGARRLALLRRIRPVPRRTRCPSRRQGVRRRRAGGRSGGAGRRPQRRRPQRRRPERILRFDRLVKRRPKRGSRSPQRSRQVERRLPCVVPMHDQAAHQATGNEDGHCDAAFCRKGGPEQCGCERRNLSRRAHAHRCRRARP
jgi:hypothetical protein